MLHPTSDLRLWGGSTAIWSCGMVSLISSPMTKIFPFLRFGFCSFLKEEGKDESHLSGGSWVGGTIADDDRKRGPVHKGQHERLAARRHQFAEPALL